MPTNEERREVAMRLRNDASRPDIMSDYDIDRGSLALLIEYDALQYFDASASELLNGLADLIEPEPERTCHVVVKERKISRTQTLVTKSCSRCGYAFGDEERRPVLPGLDDEIVIYKVRIPNYCPECGAKVVDE